MSVPNPLTELLLAAELDKARVRFDWRPNVENGRVTFEADLIRGDRRSAISFEINLLKLTEAQLTRLRIFLERRHAGVTTHYEMALTPTLKHNSMNDPIEKLTLAEALEWGILLEQLPKTADPPLLYAPGLGLDQAPPTTPCLGTPVPKDTFIQQPPHPEQKQLVLQPIERHPDKGQRQAFDAHWAAIERSTADEAEAMAKAARWWLPYPVPIPTASPLPPDILLLSEAAKELGYRRPRRFAAFLRRYKYPSEYGVISRRALTFLLAKKDARRLESKNNSQKANRANAVPEPKERVPNTKQPAAS